MYDGSLGISSYPLESLPVYKIIRALVDDLVGEVLVEHLIEPESQDQVCSYIFLKKRYKEEGNKVFGVLFSMIE